MKFEVETLLKEEINSKYCLADAKCVITKETVLHCVSRKGYDKIVDVLLKYNTNPNARTETGETSLHYAVKFSHFNIVKALLSNGAIYNALSHAGKTPLDFATGRKIHDLLIFLIDIFKKVQDNDISVLRDLSGKNEDKKRILIRTQNQESKTLLDLAHICAFPKTDELQYLFDSHIHQDNPSSFMHDTLLRKKVEIFGADSQPVFDTKQNLAVNYLNQGYLDKAEHLFREVYDSRKKTLGEDHEKTLIVKAHINYLVLKQEKTQEALNIFEIVRNKLKEKLKHDILIMLDIEFLFSRTLFEMNKLNKVLEINNTAEKICAQNDRYRHLLTDFQMLTADVLISQGKHSKALGIYKEAYKTRKDVFTIHHELTLYALTKVANGLHLLKRYDESLKVYREVLDISKFTLPADHIFILTAECGIGRNLYCQQMLLSALKIFLSLEPKIAVVAPNSNLLKDNRDKIAAIKYELSSDGLEIMFDVKSNFRR